MPELANTFTTYSSVKSTFLEQSSPGFGVTVEVADAVRVFIKRRLFLGSYDNEVCYLHDLGSCT